MNDSSQSSVELIVAGIGLFGVLIGAVVALIGQWLMARRSEKAERAYVVANLVAALDQLAVDCAKVAFDDGTNEGHPDADGYYYAQEADPDFVLAKEQTNLRHLGSDVTYRVLVIPHRIRSIVAAVSNENEHDDPPDFPRTFELRQLSFAKLGKDVSELSGKIRSSHGIPNKPSELWDPLPSLKETIATIEERQAKRQKRSIDLGA